jgi:hypothetical protein
METARWQLVLSLLFSVAYFPIELLAQHVTISPSSLTFGTVPQDYTSTPRQLLITNTGSSALQISSIFASADYTQTNDCPSSLPTLESCTINVTFSPGGTLGPLAGSISIVDSDIFSPQVASLSGTSVVHMEVGGYNPQPIFFGLYQGTVVLNNLPTPITISASTSGPFVETNNCSNPLLGGGRCSLQVALSPNATGPVSGLLVVNNVTEGTSFTWPLSAVAPGSAQPGLSFNPTALFFWNQLVGAQSNPQFLLVTNQGNVPIRITSIGIAGPFSLLGDSCTGQMLSPFTSWCGLEVASSPSAPGYGYGAITIASTDPKGPQVIVLDGLAINQPVLVPNSVTSSAQPVGTIGPAHLVTLTNYRPVSLHIASITSSAGYVQATTCGTTLNAYSSCTISVSFAPNQTGPVNGSIAVVHDATNGPTLANLYGTGLRSAFMNTTQKENAKTGDPSWRLTTTATNREIEGYASATSVNRGAAISFYVNTASPSYTMDIYRMGWYGGLGARRLSPTITLPGIRQPAPITDPSTFLVQCPWIPQYTLSIPDSADPTDWASGIYLVKLTESIFGKQSYIIFVLRDDLRISDLLFQSPTNTYNAYNSWGGSSLYSTPQAYKVSYDRPYNFGSGSGQFMQWGWENSMLRFLEREGYDVTYATDLDTHSTPNIFFNHKAVLDVGHDEYWSWEMRDNWEAARDSGINQGFFGSDDSNWQVRFEPSTLTGVANRTMVSYKKATLDPYNSDGNPDHLHLVTVRFADPPVNRAEAAMVGVQYIFQTFGEYDMVVADSSHWAFANTGLEDGDHLAGLLGYEADEIAASTPADVDDLTHSPYQVMGVDFASDMTAYTTISGSTVVAAGSMHWAWAMDDLNTAEKTEPQVVNPAVQQSLRNVLARFGVIAP